MVTCTKCQTQNRDDTKYCKNCGTRLSDVAGPVVACSKCNASNFASSLFCNRCGERLSPATASLPSKVIASKPAVKTANGSVADQRKTMTATAVAIKNPREVALPKPQEETPSVAPAENVPDWLARFYQTPPNQTRLIPTHDLLRMANALGVDVDYSTLRFWQKRGLVSKPTRGRVSSGRGTRGYYDPSLIDRLSFIREIQKIYAMNLELVRAELEQIDQQLAGGHNSAVDPYKARLAELSAQRDLESKRTLVSVLSKVLGLDTAEIASVTVQKKNGQTIRFLPDQALQESEKR